MASGYAVPCTDCGLPHPYYLQLYYPVSSIMEWKLLYQKPGTNERQAVTKEQRKVAPAPLRRAVSFTGCSLFNFLFLFSFFSLPSLFSAPCALCCFCHFCALC